MSFKLLSLLNKLTWSFHHTLNNINQFDHFNQNSSFKYNFETKLSIQSHLTFI